jgi:hypothetical protein
VNDAYSVIAVAAADSSSRGYTLVLQVAYSMNTTMCRFACCYPPPSPPHPLFALRYTQVTHIAIKPNPKRTADPQQQKEAEAEKVGRRAGTG